VGRRPAQKARNRGARGEIVTIPPEPGAVVTSHAHRPSASGIAAIGSAFGFLDSMALSRLLDGVLYGSRATDPLIILAVGSGLVVLAVAAASGPA
jgi:hypothetical protein